MEIYEPGDDSFLLADIVRKKAYGKVLDMGTGSGIQAKAALEIKKVKSVDAVDINKKAKEWIGNEMNFIHSDLFEKVQGRYDTIIFNPPYLPQDKGVEDIALYGGKKGYELIEKFLAQVNNHLNYAGQILLLFSSHTKQRKVEEFIENNLLKYRKIAEKKIFMEKLFVYELKKSSILIELEKKGVHSIQKYAKGTRGVVYKGLYKTREVAIKIEKVKSSSANEAKWLKIVNKHGIGPKYEFSGPGYVVYQFAHGEYMHEFLEKSSKGKIVRVLKDIIHQCRILDINEITKEEMTRPFKNIIIDKKVTLLDFERSKKRKNTKNVSQFCMFLIRRHTEIMIKEKGLRFDRDKVIFAARNYKKDQTDKHFKQILELIR